MKRITVLAPFAPPFAALLVACGSSSSHAPRPQSESALTSPGLGSAVAFTVLAGSAVTNTGPSTVDGDLGVAPGTAVTGFPPGIETGGVMHVADAVAQRAQDDLTTAYDTAAAAPCTRDLSGVDLGGLTLGEGVYCFSSSAQLTGTLTLDAKGKAAAVFIFKTASTLTTGSNASVAMINGATGCQVFWKIGSSATVGTNTAFVGSILALTSITLQTGATVDGRALARNGAVTMDDNRIAFPTCIAADAGTGTDTGGGDSDTGATADGGVDPSDSGATDSGSADDTAPPPCDPDMEGDCF